MIEIGGSRFKEPYYFKINKYVLEHPTLLKQTEALIEDLSVNAYLNKKQ